jgi:hypothetical protein
MIFCFALIAAALFLFSLACMFYVGFRFLSLVLSMEIGIVKEFRGGNTQVLEAVHEVGGDAGKTQSKLKDFIASRFTPTEGEFIPVTDEEQFIQEQVEHLRQQGLTDEELDAFIRQAVADNKGQQS